MYFETNAAIVGNNYGITKYDRETKTNVFVSLGTAAFIEEIQESIETEDISLKLSFTYHKSHKRLTLSRAILVNKNEISKLAEKGIDVTLKNFNTFVDTIRIQERDIRKANQDIIYTYENLGWIQIPNYDNDGNVESMDLCYRSYELIGDYEAKYTGTYLVTPNGNFKTWRTMVIDEVIGHTIAELVLISALTAIIVGVLAQKVPVENPIMHFYYLSGKGKSTMAHLATSIAGQPFNGELKIFDTETGNYVSKRSLLQSWASTSNAIVTTQAGNRGVPTILDEFGKFKGKNPSDLIFNFSEGSDKQRLNGEMKSYISEGYNTVFLSFGESSLLEKCSDKLEGLNVRVMEINEPLTKDSAQARKIKNTVANHNGWASFMLAEYIINNGGINYVKNLYDKWITELSSVFPETPSGERVIEKFYALFLTTAEIATDALDIPFSIEALKDYLYNYELTQGKKRNVSVSSYEILIEYFDINKSNFYIDKEEIPKHQAWGKITNKGRISTNGKTIIREYAVRRSIVHKALLDNGFQNKETCISEWKNAGLIEHDKDRHTRSRKIEPKSKKQEDVYVFVVYEDDNIEVGEDNDYSTNA